MLYIMRHGKTDWNACHKLQGRTDIPLNDEGRMMAAEAGKKSKGNSGDFYAGKRCSCVYG